MRTVIQRVKEASVSVNGSIVGSIPFGLLVYFGVAEGDTPELCSLMASKIAKMRIFCDQDDKMNLSVCDVNGSVLVVSQFTLYADLHKGNRPSYSNAGNPVLANELYEVFKQELKKLGLTVQSGVFGAHMHVCYENDGPVTIIADSDDLFKK